jgi:hypothetical protein
VENELDVFDDEGKVDVVGRPNEGDPLVVVGVALLALADGNGAVVDGNDQGSCVCWGLHADWFII